MLEFPALESLARSALVVALGVLLSIPSLIAGTPLPRSIGRSGCRSTRSASASTLPAAAICCSRPTQRDAQKQRLQAMEDSVATELRRDPRIDIGDISTAGGRLSFLVRNPTQVDAAVERMRNADPAGGAHRQSRLGRAGRRFDARRPDPDRERHGAGAEGRDGRRARRRPPPHRSRRDQGNHRHHRRRQPDPGRGAGRRGSRSAEEADRPDRAARVQARRPVGQSRRTSSRAARRRAARCCRWPTAPASWRSSAG